MILLEVSGVQDYYSFLQRLELDKKYPSIKLVPLRENEWGKECYLVDPSGVLWHFANSVDKLSTKLKQNQQAVTVS